MPELELSGAKVFYTEDGAGQDVLLLHSGGSSSSQWRGMAPRLGAGHRLIAPDFFGHGKTDPWPGPAAFSQDDQADLVAAVMEKACTAPVNIVGHSFGGAVAIRLALRRPEWVSRLALIEPILPTLLKAPEPALFEEYLEVAGGFIAAAEDNQPARAWAIFLDYRNGAGTWERMGEATRNRFLGQTD